MSVVKNISYLKSVYALKFIDLKAPNLRKKMHVKILNFCCPSSKKVFSITKSLKQQKIAVFQ